MRIRPASENTKKQIARYGIGKKFEKQKALFELNPLHPSLHTEKLEPKHVGLYSFRLDKKYRATFQICYGEAEVVHITNHYKK